MLTTRLAEDTELARIRDFYRATNYAAGVAAGDRAFVAEDDGELRGVVRLTREHEVTVLRGMRVSPAFQRRGIGTRLLTAVAATLGDEPCYCIPYEHLLGFYGAIGFRAIAPVTAPTFLVERLRDYRQRWPERRFGLMLRSY